MSITINQEIKLIIHCIDEALSAPNKGVFLIIANLGLVVAFISVNDYNLCYWTAALPGGCLDCNVSNASVSFRVYIGYSAYHPLAYHSVVIGYRNYVANFDNAVLNVPLLSWY